MPTDKVHILHTARPVNVSAVERLELALEDARKGDIIAVAIASTTFDGTSRTAWSTAENTVTLLGSVEILKLRIANGLAGE